MLKFSTFRIVIPTLMVIVFLFLFTRPGDYRNLIRDISGTIEDQWCAWSKIVGYKCDRWRHARRIIDEAKQFGEELGSRLPATAPLEDANSKRE